MITSVNMVVGLNWGDEGKGLATNYFCTKKQNPIVIRFNGGHQAGHTVETSKYRHVFSNFGSGTLAGAPTYWSKYCTIEPAGLIEEYNSLKTFKPRLYIDSLCPVTTPYDILYNRFLEEQRGGTKHGSVGVGFGTTIARHDTPYKLYAGDLLYPFIMENRLRAIEAYYFSFSGFEDYYIKNDGVDMVVNFLNNGVFKLGNIVTIISEEDMFAKLKDQHHFYDLVMEGAQGIMLDMDHGVFPHVTRSNTTSKNAIELLKRHHSLVTGTTVWYISRAYHTRHGEGPFVKNVYETNPYEDKTNLPHDWQGTMRMAPLELDIVDYAIKCDRNYSADVKHGLFMTCLNQVEDNFQVQRNGMMFPIIDKRNLYSALGFLRQNVIESYSPLGVNELKAV